MASPSRRESPFFPSPFGAISLGAAVVLFVALVFGHFGFSVPKAVMALGWLLFVYAVGLQARLRFFCTFRWQGLRSQRDETWPHWA